MLQLGSLPGVRCVSRATTTSVTFCRSRSLTRSNASWRAKWRLLSRSPRGHAYGNRGQHRLPRRRYSRRRRRGVGFEHRPRSRRGLGSHVRRPGQAGAQRRFRDLAALRGQPRGVGANSCSRFENRQTQPTAERVALRWCSGMSHGDLCAARQDVVVLVVVTGQIASGKSTVACGVTRELQRDGTSAAVVDLDVIYEMLDPARGPKVNQAI